jgi:periplasmic copper chaperone A
MPNIKDARYLLAVAALAAHTAAASAHVAVQPNEAVAGSYFQMAFVVPHGCDGKATVALRVKVPDGVMAVKPQMKPGWSVDIKTRKLDAPQPGAHGKSISETVDEVSWRGGPLPDNLYDTFGLMMKLPEMPNSNLYFPVVQECDEGVHRWIEIPADGQSREDLREPAPLLRLKPKSP